MDSEYLSLVISNVGLLQQTVASILLAFLFLILNSNKKLASYQLFLSWLSLSVSLIALVVQYSSILDWQWIKDSSTFTKLTLNGCYLIGKGSFFIFFFYAVVDLCEINKRTFSIKRRQVIWVWLSVSIIAIFTTGNLNHFVILQAPLAIILLLASAYYLKKYYPGVGIGRKVVPIIIYINMLLWVVYLLSFPAFMDDYLQIGSGKFRSLLSYNSYADLLGQMLMAFGMLIVIFDKSSKKLQCANDQLQQLNSSLKKESYLDPLTGSYNRRALDDHFKNRRSRDSSLVICDLDNFKPVNDRLGHVVGDEILTMFVQYIKQSLRKGDNIYRVGGDEFIIWMQDCSKTLAQNRFRYLIKNVPNMPAKFEEYRLNFSYGCAAVDSNSLLNEMIEEADKLMYLNKKNKGYPNSN